MRIFGRSPNRDLIRQAYQAWDAEDWQRAGESLEAVARQAPDARGSEELLHDGVPNGKRILPDTAIPVFDEILLFTPSELATLSVTVTASATDDIEALLAAFEQDDFGAELLSSGRPFCKCCSEGSHAVDRALPAGRQTVLIAAPEQRATELLDQWRSDRPDNRDWTGLHQAT